MQNTLEREDIIREIRKTSPGRDSRGAFQARARGAVVLGIALFVLSQVGLRVIIEEFRPELRDPTFEIKYRQFARLKAQCKQPPAIILFMGSSITAHGMKADMVDEALSASSGRSVIGFNLATNAAGPFTQLVYVQRLLRRDVRPDLVVLELSPIFFNYRDAPNDIGRFPAYALGRHDLDTVERYSREPALRHEWWQSYLVPTHGHRLTILNQSALALVPFNDRLDLWHDMDAHGWRRREIPTPEDHRTFLARIKQEFGPPMAVYQVGQPPVKALREVTGLLAQERIPTTMVLMPEGPVLRSCYRPGSLTPLMAEFTTLSRVHGFPLIQAREWFEEEKFIDSYHLTHEGAKEFTARLLREIIAPTMNALHESEWSKNPHRVANDKAIGSMHRQD